MLGRSAVKIRMFALMFGSDISAENSGTSIAEAPAVNATYRNAAFICCMDLYELI